MRTFKRSKRWAVGAAATSAALAAALAIPIATQSTGATAQAATSKALATYTTWGIYNWTVPAGVTTVTFTVFGASGSGMADGSILLSAGGPGGEARGQFAVHGGEVFVVVVGGSGASGAGGNNGGGIPAGSNNDIHAGAGGGGSDVRIGGLTNPCAKFKTCTLPDRIVVGGGGGGGGTSGNGLAGGGARGAATADEFAAGQDGTMDHCPAAVPVGLFGCGGEARNTSVGAGGGGWYGGDAASTIGGGGGGGSGYVSPFALTAAFPGGTHVGDGRVAITTP